MHEQAIQHYFADKEPMLVEAVSRLVRIDSTLGPALPGKPFGEGRPPPWRSCWPWPGPGACQGRIWRAMWAQWT